MSVDPFRLSDDQFHYLVVITERKKIRNSTAITRKEDAPSMS